MSALPLSPVSKLVSEVVAEQAKTIDFLQAEILRLQDLLQRQLPGPSPKRWWQFWLLKR